MKLKSIANHAGRGLVAALKLARAQAVGRARASYQWSILVPARLSFDRSNFSSVSFLITSREQRFASSCIIINSGLNPWIPRMNMSSYLAINFSMQSILCIRVWVSWLNQDHIALYIRNQLCLIYVCRYKHYRSITSSCVTCFNNILFNFQYVLQCF